MSAPYLPQQPYNNDNLQQPVQMYPQQPMYPPGYQQPMMQPLMKPRKARRWPWIIALIVVFFIGIAIGNGIGSSSSTSITRSTNTTQPDAGTSTQPGTAAVPVGTIAKIGQTITVDQVSCTLVSAKVLAPDEFNKPKAGYQYIVVHVTMKNASTGQVSYNPFDFHIKSATGNVTDADFSTPASYTANNTLNSGNLDPNGSVNGDIIFQAPIGDTKAELTWASSIFANNTQYGWTLGAY